MDRPKALLNYLRGIARSLMAWSFIFGVVSFFPLIGTYVLPIAPVAERMGTGFPWTQELFAFSLRMFLIEFSS